mmetsp:Transcript_17244/g.51786  ORF Transcript_17244/g.51786 Transcript_17244/m.51786 type:complete len:338 (-) Transcript_17244:204-1217(-)
MTCSARCHTCHSAIRALVGCTATTTTKGTAAAAVAAAAARRCAAIARSSRASCRACRCRQRRQLARSITSHTRRRRRRGSSCLTLRLEGGGHGGAAGLATAAARPLDVAVWPACQVCGSAAGTWRWGWPARLAAARLQHGGQAGACMEQCCMRAGRCTRGGRRSLCACSPVPSAHARVQSCPRTPTRCCSGGGREGGRSAHVRALPPLPTRHNRTVKVFAGRHVGCAPGRRHRSPGAAWARVAVCGLSLRPFGFAFPNLPTPRGISFFYVAGFLSKLSPLESATACFVRQGVAVWQFRRQSDRPGDFVDFFLLTFRGARMSAPKLDVQDSVCGGSVG